MEGSSKVLLNESFDDGNLEELKEQWTLEQLKLSKQVSQVLHTRVFHKNTFSTKKNRAYPHVSLWVIYKPDPKEFFRLDKSKGSNLMVKKWPIRPKELTLESCQILNSHLSCSGARDVSLTS